MQYLKDTIASVPTKIAIFIIRCYQLVFSPLFPSTCRFEPTCSHYGVQAFQKHGFIKGLSLTVKRIIKCRPGGPHGYDPVP